MPEPYRGRPTLADEPSLDHGPNPALAAQPGVDEPPVFSMPEYPDGAGNPYNTGEAAPEPKKAKATAKAKAAPVEEPAPVAEEPPAVAEEPPAVHKSAGGKAGGRA